MKQVVILPAYKAISIIGWAPIDQHAFLFFALLIANVLIANVLIFIFVKMHSQCFSPICLLVKVTQSVRSIEETAKLMTVQTRSIWATPFVQVRQVTQELERLPDTSHR